MTHDDHGDADITRAPDHDRARPPRSPVSAWLRAAYHLVRKQFFTKPRSHAGTVVVPGATIAAVEQTLAERNFEPWPLSYNYRGEDLNMRRPYYVDDEYQWYQFHVRGYATIRDGMRGVELDAHYELSSVHHSDAHTDGVNISTKDAAKDLSLELAAVGVEAHVKE